MSGVKITIKGADAFIAGKFPIAPVVDATSFLKQGYQFTQRYKQGSWDGRIRLFSKAKASFPAGLVSAVKASLEEAEVRVMVDDLRRAPPAPPFDRNVSLEGVSFDYPYDYQLAAAEAMVKAQRGILYAATNAGKSEIFCIVAATLRLPTLLIVPGKELLYQTQERIATRFGISQDEVGTIGDGQWRPNPWMTVGVVNSLVNSLTKEQGHAFLDAIELVVLDESHHGAADTYYSVMRACDAFYRFGMSGTPLHREDGADLKLIASTGPVVYEVRNKFLIERGISSEVEIKMVDITEPEIPKKTPYRDVYDHGIVGNTYRNRVLASIACKMAEANKKVLVLVRQIEHGKILDKQIQRAKQKDYIAHTFISGKEATFLRKKAIDDFKKGDLQILIATSILDEGVDIPSIDVLILAGSGKSSIKTLQRIGRGIRRGSTGKLLVIDTADYQHKYLLSHSLQRLSDYKEEDCFDIKKWAA